MSRSSGMDNTETVGVEALYDQYSANRTDIREPNEKDRTVERLARSICNEHGIDFDSLNTECRVMERIAVGSTLFGDPYGRLATHDKKFDEHLLLIREDMFCDDDLLYGVVAHELAHAVQHHEWQGSKEDDPAFVFLCEMFGGFRGAKDINAHVDRFDLPVQ